MAAPNMAWQDGTEHTLLVYKWTTYKALMSHAQSIWSQRWYVVFSLWQQRVVDAGSGDRTHQQSALVPELR